MTFSELFQKLLSWLPLIVAFVAGSFALYQIRSNNITNARIKWLENFRLLISDFMAECSAFELKQAISKSIRTEELQNDMAEKFHNNITENIIEDLKKIELKHDLIKLNLNPKEDLHQKFESILDGYMKLFNTIPLHDQSEDFTKLLRASSSHLETLLLLSRYILKLEWEKTKRTYFSTKYYMNFGMGSTIKKEALELKLLPERKSAS